MKNLILLGLLTFSFNTFSQSYLILQSGITLTTDKSGKVWDLSNLSYLDDFKTKGGSFFLERSALVVINESGLLYRKSFEVKGKVKGQGQNYFITDKGELVTIDAQGFHYSFTNDASILKKVTKFGGNYFAIEDSSSKKTEIYTVNSKGNYFKVSLSKINTLGLSKLGGNFFTTKDGSLYTVSQEGVIISKTEKLRLETLGGNYFLTVDKVLYAVTDEGYVFTAVTPDSFDGQPKILGSNYMISKTGVIFVMDKSGTLHENAQQSHDILSLKHSSLIP